MSRDADLLGADLLEADSTLWETLFLMMCTSFALGLPFDRAGDSLPHFYIKIKFPADWLQQ
jgi:hypothetical protein